MPIDFLKWNFLQCFKIGISRFAILLINKLMLAMPMLVFLEYSTYSGCIQDRLNYLGIFYQHALSVLSDYYKIDFATKISTQTRMKRILDRSILHCQCLSIILKKIA